MKAHLGETKGDLRWYRDLGRRPAFLHNLASVLFFISLLSALTFYVGGLQAIFGNREFFREVHVITGIACIAVMAVGYFPLRDRPIAKAWNVLTSWTIADSRFVRGWISSGRRPTYSRRTPNGGQKIATAIIAASMVVLIISGLILRFFRYFPYSFRVGSTIAHTVFFYLIMAVVVGHLYFVVVDKFNRGPNKE